MLTFTVALFRRVPGAVEALEQRVDEQGDGCKRCYGNRQPWRRRVGSGRRLQRRHDHVTRTCCLGSELGAGRRRRRHVRTSGHYRPRSDTPFCYLAPPLPFTVALQMSGFDSNTMKAGSSWLPTLAYTACSTLLHIVNLALTLRMRSATLRERLKM